MQKYVVRQPILTTKEERLLDQTLERYNNACDFIAQYADEHFVYTVERLRKHPHHNILLRTRVINKFGLQSGLVEAAMRRVVADFSAQNPKCRNRRREVIPTYQDNDWVLCTSNATKGGTASIIMPALHAAHTSKLPLKLSLATYKKDGRLRVPFHTKMIGVPDGEDWVKGRLALTRNPHPAEGERKWVLICHVDVPDDEEK